MQDEPFPWHLMALPFQFSTNHASRQKSNAPDLRIGDRVHAASFDSH